MEHNLNLTSTNQNQISAVLKERAQSQMKSYLSLALLKMNTLESSKMTFHTDEVRLLLETLHALQE